MVQAEEGTPPVPSTVDEQFATFFNEHYEPLLAFATWWGGNPHDADEALALVMAYMHRRWAEIREPPNYARRALTNTILNIRRDRGDGRCVPAPTDRLPDDAGSDPDLNRMEGEQWVQELLAELPPTQYAVLSRFLDGLSLKEIAEELRKSESTIRQNFKLARDRLRPHVRQYDRRMAGPASEQKTREDDR